MRIHFRPRTWPSIARSRGRGKSRVFARTKRPTDRAMERAGEIDVSRKWDESGTGRKMRRDEGAADSRGRVFRACSRRLATPSSLLSRTVCPIIAYQMSRFPFTFTSLEVSADSLSEYLGPVMPSGDRDLSLVSVSPRPSFAIRGRPIASQTHSRIS